MWATIRTICASILLFVFSSYEALSQETFFGHGVQCDTAEQMGLFVKRWDKNNQPELIRELSDGEASPVCRYAKARVNRNMDHVANVDGQLGLFIVVKLEVFELSEEGFPWKSFDPPKIRFGFIQDAGY